MNIKIMPENTSRKIDKGGRLTIPAGMRNRFGLELGDKMDYFVIDVEGEQYIAFKSSKDDEKIEES